MEQSLVGAWRVRIEISATLHDVWTLEFRADRTVAFAGTVMQTCAGAEQATQMTRATLPWSLSSDQILSIGTSGCSSSMDLNTPCGRMPTGVDDCANIRNAHWPITVDGSTLILMGSAPGAGAYNRQ
jgi:hypothetical protein